jgi:hypothetical protein
MLEDAIRRSGLITEEGDPTAIGKSATPRMVATVATHHQPAVPSLPTSPLTGIHAAITSSDPANHGHYVATLSMMPARENISNPSVMVKVSGAVMPARGRMSTCQSWQPQELVKVEFQQTH